MSVVTSYSTRIRLEKRPGQGVRETPGWLLLVDAIEAAAETHGGRKARSISDYFGRAHHCDLALVTPGFPRGIGIKVEASGDVTFLYDDYGHGETARVLAGEVSQNFAALALARALEILNYSVEVEEAHGEEGHREILVKGGL